MKFFTKKAQSAGPGRGTLPQLKFFNTLSGDLEPFEPLSPGAVKMYNCGPTVYDRQHIGNLLPPTIFNVLRNSLEYWGYEVRQVNNITDVGHLTGDNEGDADTGDDRMSKGLRREGLALTLENMKALAEKYAQIYLEDIAALNVPVEKIMFPRASDYIEEDIALIAALAEKGYGYTAEDGVYFDVSRFPDYGKLGNINLAGLKEGARIESETKKHTPYDFALWKFDKSLGWESPWGRGFPGWHIECTAMIFKLLGKSIDIHTGGIEHIPVHHQNEIAQAEAASGKKFVNVWLHNNHITMNGEKISKSLGNVAYLSDIVSRGLSPLSLRYWFLTAHYRSQANFSWEALEGAAAALRRLERIFREIPVPEADRTKDRPLEPEPDPNFMQEFLGHIANDLDTPKALASVWDLIRNQDIAPEIKRASLIEADKILGLKFTEGAEEEIKVEDLPEDIQNLLKEREAARAAKDFAKSDELRDKLQEKGFEVSDTSRGQKISQIK
ncbi:MAG: cysteine--tRNA ligase [Minisyncoccia bacterium]